MVLWFVLGQVIYIEGYFAQRVLASRAVKCGPVNDRCPTSVAKQQ